MLFVKEEFLLPSRDKRLQHFGLIIRPQELGQQRKSGLFDDTVMLDDPEMEFLGAEVAKHAQEAERGEPVLDVSLPFLRKAVAAAAQSIGIVDEITLHQLRHSGASNDALKRSRSLLEIKSRGGWASDSSLFRYEKHGQLQAAVNRLGDAASTWCEWSAAHLGDVIRGLTSPPPLPCEATDIS